MLLNYKIEITILCNDANRSIAISFIKKIVRFAHISSLTSIKAHHISMGSTHFWVTFQLTNVQLLKCSTAKHLFADYI